MERIGGGTADNEIGFGQMTEILRVKVDLVVPLPDPIANLTVFFAAVIEDAARENGAAALVEFFAGKTAQKLIQEAGVT